MKRLALSLAALAATVLANGCASNGPKIDIPANTPLPKVNTKQNISHHVFITEHTEEGEVTKTDHIIVHEDSTVARPEVQNPSMASVGDDWWGSKAGNYKRRAIEQSSFKQNVDMGLQYARLQGLDGSGVVVGVVDTGIDTNNPEAELEAERVVGSVGVGINGVDHANAVVAMAAGSKNGIAPKAKVFDAKNTGYSREINRVISEASEHASIINYSGNSFLEADGSQKTIDEAKHMKSGFTKAIKEKGALIVQSTGNDGLKNPAAHAHLTQLDPELKKGWIMVTALNSTENKTLGAEKDGHTVWANACGDFADSCMSAPGFYTYRGERLLVCPIYQMVTWLM